MTVTLVRSDAPDCGTTCGEWLALTGQIVPGSADLLRTALVRLGRRSVPVLVDSPGGNVDVALLMGRMIRERKLDVVVSGTALTDCSRGDAACAARLRAGQHPGYLAAGIAACASACVLVLAAGTDRSVPPNSYVGVHQMIMHQTFKHVINTFRVMRRMVGGRAVEISRTLISSRPVSSTTVQSSAPETLYARVDRFLLAMGIAQSIMPLMRSTPSSSIHWMSPTELSTTGLSTDATDAATLVARAAGPTPSRIGSASARNTTPLYVEGRFVVWKVTREGTDDDGIQCPLIEATADIPELDLQAAMRFGGAPDTWGTDASITLRVSSLNTPSAGPVNAITFVEFRQFAGWRGLRIGGSAVRLADGAFEAHVGDRQKSDALSRASETSWFALELTLADGTTAEASFPIDNVREAVRQWLQPCHRPATAIKRAGKVVAVHDAASTSAASGSAMVVRSDLSTENGSARWELADSALPTLDLDLDFSRSRLHVHVTIEASPDLQSSAGFSIRQRFSKVLGTAGPPVMSVALPQFRDSASDPERPIGGVVIPGEAGSFSIGIDRNAADAFVSGLQDRAWLALPAVTNEGRSIAIVLPLGGAPEAPLALWLHRCCGAAGAILAEAPADQPDARQTTRMRSEVLYGTRSAAVVADVRPLHRLTAHRAADMSLECRLTPARARPAASPSP